MIADEFTTSNCGIAYPFRDGEDIPDGMKVMFVDAALAFDDFDTVMESFTRDSENGKTSFTIGGESFEVMDSDINPDSDFHVLKKGMSDIVLNSKAVLASPSFSYAEPVHFEASCFFPEYTGVTSIEIFNGGDGTGDPDAILTGDCEFLAGYNSSLSDEDDTADEGEAGSSITISFGVGDGLGTVPCTDECPENPLAAGSPLTTKDGHTLIVGDGCYEISQKLDTITIHGKCVACCQCQDYFDKVLELKNLADDINSIKERVVDTHEKSYYSLIDLFELDRGDPMLDIQMDIVPDADMALLASKDNMVSYMAEPGYFRIICKVTNTTGVPCFVAAPDNQTDEYAASTLNGIKIDVYDYDQTSVSSTLSPKSDALSTNVSGQARYNSKTGESVKPTINLKASKGYSERIDIAKVSAELMNKALKDLVDGTPVSKAKMLKETAKLSQDVGYLLSPGQSFTINTLYKVDNQTISTSGGVKVTVNLLMYAPMAIYASAYNRARPVTNVFQEEDDSYSISTEFSLSKEYGIGYTEEDVKRACKTVTATLFYDLKTGEKKRS